MPPANATDDRIYVLHTRWQNYVSQGLFEHFIEFTVAINSLAEHFNRLKLAGLVRLCEGLENMALAHLGQAEDHPISEQNIHAIQRQLETLLKAVNHSRLSTQQRRTAETRSETREIDWVKPRKVQIITSQPDNPLAQGLQQQLDFFGFKTEVLRWGETQTREDVPLAELFIPEADRSNIAQECNYIGEIRKTYPACQLIYLGAEQDIETIVTLMRSGIDQTIPQQDGAARILNCVLDLVQNYQPEQYRVLVVEDSKVAVALIQRTLAGHGIDSHAIRDPAHLLEELKHYRPDLILMDMYMPRFNGVEATRVLRQMSAYHAIPIVYLSGESDIGKQVEALRLGGDQFLNKPFNPVLLAAVVKTKIERFRETLRSTRLDGLTGLFNHTAAKSALKDLVEISHTTPKTMSVAMIDIDHFKAVNDTYGHPVGDQVIRGLAWLLKGRLRASDLIGRYGGEEFLLALPDISAAQAKIALDRIREDFSALPHPHAAGALFATFSAGIASLDHYPSAATLTEAADQALLTAKQRGRNQIVIMGEENAILNHHNQPVFS